MRETVFFTKTETFAKIAIKNRKPHFAHEKVQTRGILPMFDTFFNFILFFFYNIFAEPIILANFAICYFSQKPRNAAA